MSYEREEGALVEDSKIGSGTRILLNSVVRNSTLGRNVKVLPFAMVHQARIGDNCLIGIRSIIWGAEVGKYTKIISNCFLPGYVKVGDYVFIGPGTTFINDTYPNKIGIEEKRHRGCIVKDEVMIGANSTIGVVTIGEGSLIGMGSVVTEDIPPYSLAYGNPCRVIKNIEDEDKYRTNWKVLDLKGRT